MSATNNRLSQPPKMNKEQKEKLKKDLAFKTEEIEVYDNVTKEMGWDNKNQEDLTTLPKPEELTEQQKLDLMKDPTVRTITKDPNDNPTYMDTIRDNEEVPDLTNKVIKEMKDEAVDAKNNLIVWLGSQEKIRMHISKGMIKGKKLWVEKEFWFNSIDKTQELEMKMLQSRQISLGYKNTIIANKPTNTLQEEEVEWLYQAPIMINVAEFRYSAYEAKIRFGMEWSDFASVDTDEYAIALAALGWRTINLPYYKPKQSSSGSNKSDGKT